MHLPGTGILAQVDALRDVYAAGLGRANRTLAITEAMLVAYGVAGVALLALLVYTQRLVRVRFRRRRSPQLVVATVLLLVVSAASAGCAVRASASVHSAEDTSYARLLNLWNARALLDDA